MAITPKNERDYIMRCLKTKLPPDDDTYFERALRTARRRAASEGATLLWPHRRSCGFEIKRGALFYVLRNTSTPVDLARFKVTATGRLSWVEE